MLPLVRHLRTPSPVRHLRTPIILTGLDLPLRCADGGARLGHVPAAAPPLQPRVERVSSVASMLAGMGYLAIKEIDVAQTILGMDPLVVFGLAAVGCGAKASQSSVPSVLRPARDWTTAASPGSLKTAVL